MKSVDHLIAENRNLQHAVRILLVRLEDLGDNAGLYDWDRYRREDALKAGLECGEVQGASHGI